MLSVEQAQHSVLQHTGRLAVVERPLHDALGMVLAEDVTSDLDMPPYDKAMVDGFAVRSVDLPEGRGQLEIVGEVFAGQTPEQSLTERKAIRIMTGAPMPPGADAVVMVERTSQGPGVRGQGSVAIDDPRVKPGQNIMPRGTEMTRGQLVLKSGTLIRPPEIGLLAAVGRATVSVFPRPTVAIVSTGNEIVEAHERPGPGQIRNSNGPTLGALVTRAGGVPHYLGIAHDSDDDLRRLIRKGLEAELLLLSGGVSAGLLDLVPGVLRELGVREVFHKVNLKPGKPVWFGLRERGVSPRAGAEGGTDNRKSLALRPPPSALRPCTLVFGLPGNPVSVMVCFELFVRPAIRQMMGLADSGPKIEWANLTTEWITKSDRPTYWPAWLEPGDQGPRVRPVLWKGSPDLRATTDANAFVIFPPGDHQFRAGDRVQVLCTEY